MGLSHFHPLVSRWFSETLGEPTSAQARGWEAIRDGRHTLIAAPTGSGKTLAAFLNALDELVVEGLRGPLPDEVRVLYVSPLKALSADVHKNLAQPRRGIRALAEAAGAGAPRITAAVRTGDTTQAQRAAMLRTPPHILVTTPESLYLLLTSDRSREMLQTTRTVIVDEIHAVIGTRRGAHLALSLERLEALCAEKRNAANGQPPRLRRIGLSATQKPVEVVARFLTGSSSGDCAIVDEGHRRAMDLALEIPRSPLDAVMAHEVWEEYYDRLTELIAEHRTTLVFVNTRRLAERMARHLTERLGEGAVTAHHGSLSKDTRLDAEHRLKTGGLKALVATASLELGIDIGHVDLVCQIGSPHRIATLLQRVGRSGHTVRGMPKGRLLPVSRDDLVECAALIRAVRAGDLDRIVDESATLDVLAQQIVAEASCRAWPEEELLAMVRGAWPYRALTRDEFDAVVRMVAEGYATRRGRRAALVHRDEVHRVLRGRRGTRLLALTSGGAIPEVADYRVVLEPEETFIGTVNEDFAIESMAGDVFQLGNASWRITQVLPGIVRVVDAQGAPPSIPFWFGEAPARSDELSQAVSTLRADLERVLEGEALAGRPEGRPLHVAVADLDQEALAGPDEAALAGSDEEALAGRPEGRPLRVALAGLDQEALAGPDEAALAGSDEEALAGRPEGRPLRVALAGLDQEAAGPDAAALAGPDEEAPADRPENRPLPVADPQGLRESGGHGASAEFDGRGGPSGPPVPCTGDTDGSLRRAVAWLEDSIGICRGAAEQIATYIASGRASLGVVPTQQTLVLERFFDESGGMQLVLHAPFGSRINRAWALALRKRFCRQFNFELQAAATEDALLLSLGPQHSFPLADVFRYLHPSTVRDILVQAFLDAPVFQTRWRWNATISLAVPRSRAGKKVPPQLQRMQADDLMAAVFPDAAACLENIPGDREIPDHPLVNQTVRDCLEEAMDLASLVAVLDRIHRGELRCVAVDTPEPSAFAHDIINARLYAFLDDAPLEERRARAVQTRRATEQAGHEIGALDASAIERVRDEVRPDPRDADELHDILLTTGYLDAAAAHEWTGLLRELAATGRATHVHLSPAAAVWVAAERLPEMRAIHPTAAIDPDIVAPPSRTARVWTRDEALVELVRGGIGIAGPVTARSLAAALDVTANDADTALLALEGEGAVLRGRFSPGARDLEWCDRALLARIHRYTLHRLRAEIAPVTAADFMRFLFVWQHVASVSKLSGVDGLRAILAQLDGAELAARAWEAHVLPARLDRYEPAMLDTLCFAGEIGWGRLSTGPAQVVGATPIALFRREHADAWLALYRRKQAHEGPAPSRQDTATGAARVREQAAEGPAQRDGTERPSLSAGAAQVLEVLRARGASFAHQLAVTGLNEDDLRAGIAELVSAGLVSSDGFAGLRALIGVAPELRALPAAVRRTDTAGRWSELRAELGPELRAAEPGGAVRPDVRGEQGHDPRNGRRAGTDASVREACVERLAWSLLHRYGVVFRRLVVRDAASVPWRELARVYRRLEARGEIRGGRFVSGMPGEQFALPDAVERLRETRRAAPDGELIAICGADPLNLTGIITPGDRLRTSAATRIVYRNGLPIVAMEGDFLRPLGPMEPDVAERAAALAAGRTVPVVSGYVGRLR